MENTQTVLLGLGGTGARVVNNVARELRKHGKQINDGHITCAVLDTNQSDNALILNSGTAIPVIPTCDSRTIDEYLNLYANWNPRSWCPYSSTFGTETMIDGASEIRVKSRLAFLDTTKTGKIFELQNAIEKVFHNRPGTPEKIRVMVVSSLSGGTGSGMFIQVALWLRKFFEDRNCEATIRGIFLLPDVFIRTLSNVRDNPRKVLYHYANAYAAIRELNAINKTIKGNIRLESPIVIDDLFDSRNPCARPVFDNAFFIDDIDANGAAFNKIGAYEEMVAQIVYMQLYAPMYSELVSVEDNLFRAFDSSEDPVFGSCGTAKAEYPAAEVIRYCALRAAQDSVAEGWNRIDAEIDELIREEKAAEKDGIIIKNPVSRRDKFIEFFDEKSHKTGAEIGKSDKLFVSIRNDVFNEKRERTTEGVVDILSCKIADFMNIVEEEIQKSVVANGDCDRVGKIGKELPDPEKPENFPDGLVDRLKGVREKEKETVKKTLNRFDENCKEYADAIIRALVPLDMSSVNGNNERSLYGLFLKKDPNGKDFYVHPVAAKYLLYKLSQKIEEAQKTLAPDSSRSKALAGDKKTSFDNPKTRKTESLEEYWKQVGFFISKSEIQHFLRKYKVYNTENKTLCMQYEAELLKQMVLKELSARVALLVEEIEKMFKDFPLLNKKLGEDLEDNVKKTEENLNKTLYVYAKKEHKEAMYASLGIDLTGRNDGLNEEVVKSIYGKFCAELRPAVDENKEYVEKSIIAIFRAKIVESFETLISTKHKESVRLDIISAIKAESDYEYEKQKAASNGDGDEKNPFSETTEAAQKTVRHDSAVISYRNKLTMMAAPFLRAQPDESLADRSNIKGLDPNKLDQENEIWMKTAEGQILYMPLQTRLTFWGFHPDTAENYPRLEEVLSSNKNTAASEGYSKSELCCYSSIYGIKAEAVDKFNEQKNGEYYKHYSAVISSMITSGKEVDSPHIDKTWHEFLPYVSKAKQTFAMQKFYKAFWYAIAYGRLTLDDHGRYQISEQTTDSYGNTNYEHSLLMEDGRTIGATDISRLVRALRVHPTFETVIIPQLEERFKADVTGMTTYVGTGIVKGLLREGDLNPVTMVVRYGTSQGYNPAIKSDLVGGLGEVMRDVASCYDMNRGDDQINDAKIRLCHRIYEKSTMTKKAAFFESWLIDFERLGLVVTEETGADPVESDII